VPAHERSRAADPLNADLGRDGWHALLERGEVQVEGRMPWSSNITLLVTVRLGAVERRAVYKPKAGERPLWDFPDGLFRREVAAYELSRVLSLDVVPETVLRHDLPYGTGSLQRFVEADFEQHYFTLLELPERAEALRRIAGYDLLANNADRKGGHVLIDAAGHLWGIDNGLCFHPQPKLRTVMWDFAGEALPGEIVAACEALAGRVARSLESLLSEREIAALRQRARRLLGSRRFPEPDESTRAYPWPPV
jgi:uncharacterized repeat protein (TIGR03843 family)